MYVADIMTDEKLKECSAKSHGVYLLLICILHKQVEYGCLVLREKDLVSEKEFMNFAIRLKKFMPFETELINECLIDLKENDVIQIESNRLSQKRMIKDNATSEGRSKGGKKGMESRYGSDNGFKVPENKAKEIIKTEFRPELSVEKFEYYSSLEIWIESIGKSCKLPSSEIKSKLRGFIDELNLKEDLEGKAESDFKKHFINWLKLQKDVKEKKEVIKSSIKIKL